MVSIGEANNGVRDITTYINQRRPRVFYGHHSDDFNIGASNDYRRAIDRQFDIFDIPVSQRPEIRGLHDPYDDLRPALLTFDYRPTTERTVAATVATAPAGASVASRYCETCTTFRSSG